jgi:hypothetical protein
MKQKISTFFSYLLKDSTWRIFAILMLIAFVYGGISYIVNSFEPSRTDFIVTSKEFRKNKINSDLKELDEINSQVSKEEYEKSFKAFKSKIPSAEWNKIEIKLTDSEFEQKNKEYRNQVDFMMSNGNYDFPAAPVQIDNLPYSMKRFFRDLEDKLFIDSTDFDARLNLLKKVEHFYNLSDKKGSDTLMVDKFKDILSKSSNLSLDEILAVEKLHKSIAKTPLIFSLTKLNCDSERQSELFEMFEAAANFDITPERFEQLDTIVKRLKVKKVVDTVTVLNLLTKVMNVDFLKYKSSNEEGYNLESICIDEFFKSGRFSYDEDNVISNFSKYIQLYSDKLEASNLEKKAREILRTENRESAFSWLLFGLYFLCFSVIIVLLVNKYKSHE